MRTLPTQKLYFGRFTHCIKLNLLVTKGRNNIRGNSVVRSIKSWLTANGVPNRTRLDWFIKDKSTIDMTFGIYLSDESAYDHIIATNQDSVFETRRPATELHRELLLNRTEIIFKDRLLYNRFRYKIMFNTGWRKESKAELEDWVKTQFQGRKHGRGGDYLFQGKWVQTLYLLEDSDVILAKLSLGDMVRSIIRVDLFDEHGIDPDGLLQP